MATLITLSTDYASNAPGTRQEPRSRLKWNTLKTEPYRTRRVRESEAVTHEPASVGNTAREHIVIER